MRALFLLTYLYLLKCNFGTLMLSDNIYLERKKKEAEHFKERPKLEKQTEVLSCDSRQFLFISFLVPKTGV